MKNLNRCSTLMLLFGAVLSASGQSVTASEVKRDLVGAWATSASDCAKVFERRGNNWVYRQPIDRFTQAALIASRRIVSPTGDCRVTGVSRVNDVISVAGVCQTSVTFANQTAKIKIIGKDEIVYYPEGNSYLGTTLMKCAP